MKLKSNTLKIGRNEPCPCGSGRKFKKCCRGKSGKYNMDLKTFYEKRYKIRLKGKQDVEGIRRAGRLVIDTLDMVETKIKPGIKTDDINTLVHEFTIKNGAIPAPMNYRGFPKSVCVSVNEVICHDISGDHILFEQTILYTDNGYESLTPYEL